MIAGSLAGLFVSPRSVYHWLGLIGFGVLFVGGVAMGAAIFWTYRADPVDPGALRPVRALRSWCSPSWRRFVGDG